ncbi:hypothetical protein MN608_01315 [Microdochium nivale]|nr:hypothetical protein MN608_01315 [Microdochium nivale]
MEVPYCLKSVRCTVPSHYEDVLLESKHPGLGFFFRGVCADVCGLATLLVTFGVLSSRAILQTCLCLVGLFFVLVIASLLLLLLLAVFVVFLLLVLGLLALLLEPLLLFVLFLHPFKLFVHFLLLFCGECLLIHNGGTETLVLEMGGAGVEEVLAAECQISSAQALRRSWQIVRTCFPGAARTLVVGLKQISHPRDAVSATLR